jgi:hypothetical protein
MATWTDDIVDSLESLGGTATLDDIYQAVASRRPDLPATWKDIIRREIQRQSSDSNGFEGSNDLFFSKTGLGSGVWGLKGMVENTPVAADLPAGNDSPDKVETTTYRILRDTKLAREVKLLHRDECQLCGVALEFPGGKTYSEAHHIIPLGGVHKGPDTPGNVIVLCPNHHALCDVGAIPLLKAEIRVAAGHEISSTSIEYHNSKILQGPSAVAK